MVFSSSRYLSMLEIHKNAVPHDVRTNPGDLSINQQSIKIQEID